MPTFDSYLDIDFAWIAVDAKGHLAAFITAGEGKVPYEVFEQDIIAPAAIEHEILQMPVASGVIMNICLLHADLSSYIHLCQRGFFVYDWTGDGKRPTLRNINCLLALASPSAYSRLHITI